MTEREFTIHRALGARREQVYRAWTDPEHLGWFLNPAFPTQERIEVDPRPGGLWRMRMIVDPTIQYATGGLYLELTPPSRIVFAWGAIDGWPELDPSDPSTVPTVTIDLAEDGQDRTQMSVHVRLPEGISDEEAAHWFGLGIQAGWADTVDRLVAGHPAASPQR